MITIEVSEQELEIICRYWSNRMAAIDQLWEEYHQSSGNEVREYTGFWQSRPNPR